MPRPIIFPESRDPDERFDPSTVMGLDPGAIPGYSERVRSNDLAKADPLSFREAHKTTIRPDGKQGMTQEDYYKLWKQGPEPLDFELSWQRASTNDGTTSQVARNQYALALQEGWVPIKADDLRSRGCDVPPTAVVEADGTIRRLDVILCVRSGKLGRRWAEYREQEALKAEGTRLPDELTEGTFAAPTFVESERETVTIRGK